MTGSPHELSSDGQVFQSSFWRVALPTAAVLLLLAVCFAPSLRPDGISPGLILMAWAGGCVAAAIPLAFATWYYRTDVDTVGVGGYNLSNVYGRVAWKDIERVKFFFLLPGVTYLRLVPRTGNNVIWLPLFLKDMDGFRSLVMRFSPEKNPLRQYLERQAPGQL